MLRTLIQHLFPRIMILSIPPDQPMDAPDKLFHSMFHILVEWIEVEQPFTAPVDKTFRRATCIDTIQKQVDALFGNIHPAELMPAMQELVDLYQWYKSRAWDVSDCQFIDVTAYANAEAQIERQTKRLLELREYLL